MSVKRYTTPLYKDDNVIYTNSGTDTVPEFVLDFPATGGVALKEVGVKPLYKQIQANLDNCDLKNVIESCVHANQYSTVTADNLHTMVADFTSVTSLGELYASTKRMENTWKELPLEVREQFNGDIKQFITGFGTTDFTDKVNAGFDKFTDAFSKVQKVDNSVLTPEPDPVDIEPPAPSVNPEVLPNLEV